MDNAVVREGTAEQNEQTHLESMLSILMEANFRNLHRGAKVLHSSIYFEAYLPVKAEEVFLRHYKGVHL